MLALLGGGIIISSTLKLTQLHPPGLSLTLISFGVARGSVRLPAGSPLRVRPARVRR